MVAAGLCLAPGSSLLFRCHRFVMAPSLEIRRARCPQSEQRVT